MQCKWIIWYFPALQDQEILASLISYFFSFYLRTIQNAHFCRRSLFHIEELLWTHRNIWWPDGDLGWRECRDVLPGQSFSVFPHLDFSNVTSHTGNVHFIETIFYKWHARYSKTCIPILCMWHFSSGSMVNSWWAHLPHGSGSWGSNPGCSLSVCRQHVMLMVAGVFPPIFQTQITVLASILDWINTVHSNDATMFN